MKKNKKLEERRKSEGYKNLKQKNICDVPNCFKIASQNTIFCKDHEDAWDRIAELDNQKQDAPKTVC